MTTPTRGGQLARVIKRTTLNNGWWISTVECRVPTYGGAFHSVVYRRANDFSVEGDMREHDELAALRNHALLCDHFAGRASLPALKV